MKLLEADTKKLDYLLNLSYGTLYIPYSQRPYEWKPEQVLRLFNDFYSIYINEDPNANHILNFITIKLDEEFEDKKYIYDGQQRTVTSLLILSALVNELKKSDSNAIESANELTRLYLFKTHWKNSSATNFKIEFDNDSSNEVLHKYIFANKSLPEDYKFNDYNRSLWDNYQYIKNLIKDKFGDNPSSEDLVEFIEAILFRILVIIIETSYDNIAEEMFETLNSTGLQVEDFYILKNSLIRILNEDVVKPIWSSIEYNTDRINKNKFLHTYLNVINGKTAASNLYNKISSLRDLENTKVAKEFLNELNKTSELFMKIENPSQRIDGNLEENSRYLKNINNLQLLSANQYKPVILAMGLRDFNLSNINLALEKIISLQLRNIFIANNKANTLEQFYPSLAQKIYLRQINTIDGILASISSMIINDSLLYEHFNNKVIDSNKDEAIIRFILKEIYNSKNNEIIINSSSKDVNLEHILPKNPNVNSQWISDFPNEDERYRLTRKIGNMTVLLNKLNSKIKNSDFSIKKSTYLTSDIPENKLLGSKNEWKKSDIDERSIEMYNSFKSIWSK